MKKVSFLIFALFALSLYAKESAGEITIEVKDVDNNIKTMKIAPVRTKGKTILYNLFAIDERVLPKAVMFRLVECKDGIKKLEVPSGKWRQCNIVLMTEPTNIYLNSYRYTPHKR